jgi:hypothetical protein
MRTNDLDGNLSLDNQSALFTHNGAGNGEAVRRFGMDHCSPPLFVPWKRCCETTCVSSLQALPPNSDSLRIRCLTQSKETAAAVSSITTHVVSHVATSYLVIELKCDHMALSRPFLLLPGEQMGTPRLGADQSALRE